MNICYFSNQFAAASGHGIAHYAHRLYEGVARFEHLNVVPVATWSDLGAVPLAELQGSVGLRLLPWGRKLTPLAWAFLNAPPVEHWLDFPVDVVHMLAPGFPVATRKKLVVTVHDMGPLTHPEYFSASKPWLFRRGIAQTIRQADAIVCVSQATADDFAAYAGASVMDRVHVVHEGVDAEFFAQEPRSELRELMANVCGFEEGTPFCMAAGALSPRKNIRRVVEAFSRVVDAVPHHLVLVGGGGWDSLDVFDQLENFGLGKRVHHLGYVSNDELQSLYRHASFYLHPSLFEGFGLTVLEAMAAGCPVITSNVSSLPEVAGDAAVLVDPYSAESIAEAIRSFANDNALREAYRARGLERVKCFQWSETARRIAEIYRSV